ncbi:MAG: lipoyl(octanoyl) transferase LipB [Kiloniellales bacterium]
MEWRISDQPVPYDEAVAAMEARVAAIRAGAAAEQVWMLEHPPIYTAGTSAEPDELIDPGPLPVIRTGRGGRVTYHGPGQRVAYVMLDLNRRGPDLRRFVHGLEEWLIRALERFNLKGVRRPGRVGIWIERGGGREDKIAAIGVRVRRWVTYHGVALNVEPDLAHFARILPCGIDTGTGSRFGVTSLVDLGLPVTMADADAALIATFDEAFAGRTLPTTPKR